MIFIDELDNIKSNNIQNEVLFIGALCKNPDLIVSYSNFIRSKYDFYDEATKFYYDSIELMYKTFSQNIDENKLNVFMSQDNERFKTYKRFGAYKTINTWKNLSDVNDIKHYYDTLKKYSLIREYERSGFPVEKILKNKKLILWTADDVYRIMRTKVDKINTVISANNESIDLTKDTTKKVKSLLIQPDLGLPLPWELMNDIFKGCRLGKAVFNGFISNEGKTRNLMVIAAYFALVLEEKFLLLSNEMDEDDLQNCLIVTVINNPYFKKYHGIDIEKNEKELTLGLYRDEDGNFIYRKVDSEGQYIESEEDYLARVETNSEEYRKVLKVSQWIDRKKEGKLFFKDVGSNYSDQTLEFEFRKHKMVHGVKYCGYDTLKGYQTDDWQTVKQTATKFKEIMKELKMFGWAVFQLTDDSVFTDVFQLSSNNIANAKQIKHVADILLLGKKIEKDDYKKYQYVSYQDWGEARACDLNVNKTYFAIKFDKHRGGNKSIFPLFEIDLDLNTWVEIGYLIKRGSYGS